MQAQRTQAPAIAAQARRQSSPQALGHGDLPGLARPLRRQARSQGVPRQEIAVRQQEQAPAALTLSIEERQAFVQPVAVHAGIGLGPHRTHPAGQLAALAWPVHAQHRAQLGQLPGMRQGQRQDRRGGDGDGADGGHGYQLTARLAETARPGRV